MDKLLLFVKSDGCPECAKLKGMLRDAGFEGTEAIDGSRTVAISNDSAEVTVLDTETVDGLAEGSFHNVRSVPTLIEIDEGREISRKHGADDIFDMLMGE